MKLLVCENKKITEGGLHKKGVIDKISNNKQMIAEPNNTRLHATRLLWSNLKCSPPARPQRQSELSF